MRNIKPFFLLTLLLWGSFVQAVVGLPGTVTCIAKDQKVAPANKTGQEWTDWKAANPDFQTKQNSLCCAGLTQNKDTNKDVCEDKPVTDPNLKYCANDSECSGDKGCYPVRDQDMFSLQSENTAEQEAAKASRHDFEQTMIRLGIKPIKNGNCTSHVMCESNKCDAVSKKCVDNKICRLATTGDLTITRVKCEEPYKKDATNKCDGGIRPATYPGLLGVISVKQIPGKQCEFKFGSSDPLVSEDTIKETIEMAIMTNRGMEWLFASASGNNHEDCNYTNVWVRNMMKTKLEERKAILKAFNAGYSEMEQDFVKVSNAKKGDMTPIKSPCGEYVSGDELASRRLLGKDFLCYLRNRNDLFIIYENKMKEHIIATDKEMDKYHIAWSWAKEDTKWKIYNGETKETESGKCRPPVWWNNEVKRAWSKKYTVSGRATGNKLPLEKQTVKKYLGWIGLKDLDAAANDFKKSTYWLMDPIMPGGWNQGVSFDRYGSLDLFDVNERQLKGSNGSFTEATMNSEPARVYRNGLVGIYANFRPKIIAHLKDLRLNDVPKLDFNLEPEVKINYNNKACLEDDKSPACLALEAIRNNGGCIENLDKPQCQPMKDYVDNLQDTTFAQFLAYSKHNDYNYTEFFQNKESYRYKLFHRYDTDFTNLQGYYLALASLRTKQNECLTRAINGLGHADFNGVGKGLQEGSANYYKGKTDFKGGKDTNKIYNKAGKKTVATNPYKFKFSSNNKSLSGGVQNDQQNDQTAADTAAIDAETGAFAAKVQKLQEMNNKAVAAGVDLAAQEKALKNSLAGKILSSSSGASATGASSPTSSSSDSSSGSAPALSGDDQGDDSETKAGAGAAGSGSGAGVDLGGASAAGVFGGLTSGMGSGSDSGPALGDSTGMSDEEKDNMSANYDRTKSDYKTGDEDTLFQVLSKTYVRNLDKILTRKKKLDDENASTPTATP